MANFTGKVIMSNFEDMLRKMAFDTIEEDVYKEVCIRTKGKAISEKTEHLIAGMYCYTMFGFLMRYIWTGMQADVSRRI